MTHLKGYESPTQDSPLLLQELLNSAHELDAIIQQIVRKAEAAHALFQVESETS